MLYRPQFPIPSDARDEEFQYAFSQENTPALNLLLAPGEQTAYIPLLLESDASFFWRGLQVVGPSNYGIRFRTADGDYLSDGYMPVSVYRGFPGSVPGLPGNCPVPLDFNIWCRAGGVIYVSFKNLS
jgi:hypothetical protein